MNRKEVQNVVSYSVPTHTLSGEIVREFLDYEDQDRYMESEENNENNKCTCSALYKGTLCADNFVTYVCHDKKIRIFSIETGMFP